MPVANLQSYRSVALRVRSTAFASQGRAMYLEAAVTQQLRQKCGFEYVGPPAGTGTDVVLDLNITNAGRGSGGGGLITNSSQAFIDTLLVISDGRDGDLLGTARIRGRSGGMIINSGVPENEAIDVVAKTIAEMLAKSGCSGPRIARAEPIPDPVPAVGSAGSATGSNSGSGDGSGEAEAPDEARRAEAEAINEQGKEKLRGADIAGALAAFEQANTIVPDPRYVYNTCLALEAQERWNDAIAACKRARSMNPEARLVAKIDNRIGLIQGLMQKSR